MHALIAADKFKDALSAPQACAAIAAGLRSVHPDWTLDLCPLTDGGEGFARILTDAAGGEWRTREVRGPRGAPVVAGFGLVRTQALPPEVQARLGGAGRRETGRIAVLEMAAASGLALLSPGDRDVWQTDTRGTGDLIAAAAESGVEGVLLGVGGSATHDLGLGALAALGAELFTVGGNKVERSAPVLWPEVARVELRGLRKLPPLWIACDVVNPLLGPCGAATVYAPQKGLRGEDLPRLEAATTRLADLLTEAAGVRGGAGDPGLAQTAGAGAAGGIAFGLMTALGTSLIPGFDLVSGWLSLEARLAAADLVITGEGRFDQSSLQGKGSGSLVRATCARGGTVHVFAGRVEVQAGLPGLRLHELSPRGVSLAEALPQTESRLREGVAKVFGAEISGPRRA